MLLPFSTDIKVQQAQREQMAIMSSLAGLPTEFETANSQILASCEITSLNDAYRQYSIQSANQSSCCKRRRKK